MKNKLPRKSNTCVCVCHSMRIYKYIKIDILTYHFLHKTTNYYTKIPQYNKLFYLFSFCDPLIHLCQFKENLLF